MNLLSWKEILAENWQGIKDEGRLFVCDKIAAILSIFEEAHLVERVSDMQITIGDMWWTRLGHQRFLIAVNKAQSDGWSLAWPIDYKHGIFGLRMTGTAVLVRPR